MATGYKQISLSILRRVHSANLSGTPLTILAKANRVALDGLYRQLNAWRKANGLRGPVFHKELRKAITRVSGPEDPCNNNMFFL